jgi:hypothetical protein
MASLVLGVGSVALAEECGKRAGGSIIVVVPGRSSPRPCGASPIIRADEDEQARAAADAAQAPPAPGNAHGDPQSDGGFAAGSPTPFTTGSLTPFTTGAPTPFTSGNPGRFTTPGMRGFTTDSLAPFTTGSLAPFTTGSLGPFTTGSLAPFTAGSLGPFTTGSLGPFTTGSLARFTTGSPGPFTTGALPLPATLHGGVRLAHRRAAAHR